MNRKVNTQIVGENTALESRTNGNVSTVSVPSSLTNTRGVSFEMVMSSANDLKRNGYALHLVRPQQNVSTLK